MSLGPFETLNDKVTLIHNVVLDEIMPTLSSDGWKVLCVALRAAHAGSDAPALSLRQFVAGTGIEEPRSVESAIRECVASGYLVQQGEAPDLTYTLNTSYGEAPAEPVERDAEGDVVAIQPELEPTYHALMSFGREMGLEPDPKDIKNAMVGNDAVSVMAWIAIGRLMTHLDKPDRFYAVLDRLEQQIPPLPMSMLAQDQAEASGAEGGSQEAAQELWQSALEILETKMRSSKFRFLKPTEGVDLHGDVLTVAAPNKRIKEWLETGVLADTIEETFHKVAGRSMELRFVVAEE